LLIVRYGNPVFRLAQITNKCGDEDLDYFVNESADILGIAQALPPTNSSPKHILEYVLAHVAEFKKLNQDEQTFGFNIQPQIE